MKICANRAALSALLLPPHLECRLRRAESLQSFHPWYHLPRGAPLSYRPYSSLYMLEEQRNFECGIRTCADVVIIIRKSKNRSRIEPKPFRIKQNSVLSGMPVEISLYTQNRDILQLWRFEFTLRPLSTLGPFFRYF